MATCLLKLSVLVYMIVSFNAAPTEDLITDLPGLSWKPSFKQYSGYLDTARTRHLHYWFVESSSNPKTDPVVLWMNGGPGCSSLDGMLTEHGPFRIQDDGKTLLPNPFAWNQVANMIYLEAPAGVGFSYSDDRNYTTDDNEVAMNNHLALKEFFKKFPEYQSHDFYISGESYGGIYVPTLASVTMDDPDINLKGFVVGNGLSSDNKNENSAVYFAYYHGLVGEEKWDQLVKNCCPGDTNPCDFVSAANGNSQCFEWLSEIQAQIWGGGGLNVYNLYGECAGGVQSHSLVYNSEKDKLITSRFLYPFSSMKTKDSNVESMVNLLSAPHLKSSPPCVDSAGMATWLNTPAVKAALHIADMAQPWDICSSIVGAGYHRVYSDMTAQYQKAISKKLRVLVYNGDVDMACNFLGDEWFVNSLHPEGEKERKTWYYKAEDNTKQVAGWFKDFKQITFATIRGAGHMVPTDKPRPALKMFVSFIQNQPLNL